MLQEYLKTNPVPEFILTCIEHGVGVELRRYTYNASQEYEKHWSFSLSGFCKSGTASVIRVADGWRLCTRYDTVEVISTIEDLAEIQLDWLLHGYARGYGLESGWESIHKQLGNEDRVNQICGFNKG